jgi:hypothetical protein
MLVHGGNNVTWYVIEHRMWLLGATGLRQARVTRILILHFFFLFSSAVSSTFITVLTCYVHIHITLQVDYDI